MNRRQKQCPYWKVGLFLLEYGCTKPDSNYSRKRDEVLDDVIEFMKNKIRLPSNSGEQLSYEADIRFTVIREIKEFRNK